MLKIYLTDLSAYNKGYLFGEWISLPCDNLEEQLSKILRAGEAMCFIEEGYFELHEEYFITDWEWEDVELFEINEYEDIFKLNETLFRLTSYSTYQQKAIRFLLSEQIVKTIDNAIEKIDDVIIYENQTLSDIAFDIVNESYELDKLPTLITAHIDYEGIARDLELDGNFTIIDNDVYEYHG